jgi:KipI family sensor histidine kinase inhibitor
VEPLTPSPAALTVPWQDRRMPSDRTPAKDTRFSPHVLPAGDGAQMLVLAEELDLDANRRAQRVAERIRAAALEGVTDVIAAIVTVTVYFTAETAAQAAARRARITEALNDALAHADEGAAEDARTVEIPVCYEAPFASDLAHVAAAKGVTVDEVVRRHVASTHRVLMIGFTPGFPYIGGLDPAIAVPRRATPRARVEPGSVAIANTQTSVYPAATPGGWNVIGRTPLRLFDPAREPAALLNAGDRVVFVPVSADEFERLRTVAG